MADQLLLTRKDNRAKIPALVRTMLVWTCLLAGMVWARDSNAVPQVARAPTALAMLTTAKQGVPTQTPEFAAPAPTPDLSLLPGQALHAIFRTSLGNIDCTLAIAEAPNTVVHFVRLARGHLEWIEPRTGEPTFRRLYDGTLFHRVIPGFLIQGGDPTGSGTGGPGFSLPDEISPMAVFDRAGLLGFATRGPNTGGSQFFLTAGPARHLDGRYTRLGSCDNLAVITAIATVPRGEGNRPVRDVVLRALEVVAH